MSHALDELFSRRLLVVTGKGGTGKTTLAATLALLAARRGVETALVDIADSDGVRRLVTPRGQTPPECDGRVPAPVRPHLSVLTIEPLESLTEYLELELRVRPLVRLLVQNAGFQRLLEAAPGWRDLITLGKLWHLATRPSGPRLCVVDAPSTGHGLSFLAVPSVVTEAVRLGPLRRHAEAVRTMLTDGQQTLVVPVTLAEELPVLETFELCREVARLGLALGPAIVNAVESAPGISPERVRDALVRCEPPPALGGELSPDGVFAVLEHALERAELQRGFIEQLRSGHEGDVRCLPFLSEGVDGPQGIEQLADVLEAELT